MMQIRLEEVGMGCYWYGYSFNAGDEGFLEISGEDGCTPNVNILEISPELYHKNGQFYALYILLHKIINYCLLILI